MRPQRTSACSKTAEPRLIGNNAPYEIRPPTSDSHTGNSDGTGRAGQRYETSLFYCSLWRYFRRIVERNQYGWLVPYGWLDIEIRVYQCHQSRLFRNVQLNGVGPWKGSLSYLTSHIFQPVCLVHLSTMKTEVIISQTEMIMSSPMLQLAKPAIIKRLAIGACLALLLLLYTQREHVRCWAQNDRKLTISRPRYQPSDTLNLQSKQILHSMSWYLSVDSPTSEFQMVPLARI